MKLDAKTLLLYAVTDSTWLGAETLAAQVEQALRGGATFVQLRDKRLMGAALEAEAREIQAICRRYCVPFVLNDNVALAAAIGADGVHVGQSDMAASAARAQLGVDKIIGVSARTVEQAIQAERDGADYLGVGAVFGTATKLDARPIARETVQAICAAVSIPVIGIGGVTADNLPQLGGTGVVGAAVVSGIFAQRDIEGATQRLRQLAQQIFVPRERELR